MTEEAQLPQHECGFCKKSFRRERSLFVHICEQKRRHMSQNDPHIRLAFDLYNYFYETEMHCKDRKTFDDFRQSRYYIQFARLGKFCKDTGVINARKYLSHLVKEKINPNRWCRDATYMKWCANHILTERVHEAFNRTMEFIGKWGRNRNKDIKDFFNEITDMELIYWLKIGQISPYVLYASQSGQARLSQLTEETTLDLVCVADPSYWSQRISSDPDTATMISTQLKERGL